jgi:hypothetical protein
MLKALMEMIFQNGLTLRLYWASGIEIRKPEHTSQVKVKLKNSISKRVWPSEHIQEGQLQQKMHAQVNQQ